MQVEKLSVNGPALAALLQECVLLRNPFDGILIGSFAVRTETVHHDTAEETRTEILDAHISTFCCSEHLGSFYNGAGEIEAEEVRAVAGRAQVLGWFVHQVGNPRQPSARERTVTAALAGCVPPGMPVIFAQMCTTYEGDRSTFSFQQRYLQQAPGTLNLKPLGVRIDNLATSARSRDYQPLQPVAGFPKISVRTQGGRVQGEAEGAPPSLLGQVATHSLFPQTHALEQAYAAMLGQVGEAAEGVRREEADLKALQQEVHTLLQALGM